MVLFLKKSIQIIEMKKIRVNRHINGYNINLNEKYGIKRMAIFIK